MANYERSKFPNETHQERRESNIKQSNESNLVSMENARFESRKKKEKLHKTEENSASR